MGGHKKFVSIELFSSSHYAVRFNRFYCENLKRHLQSVPNIRFMMDFRVWVAGIKDY